MELKRDKQEFPCEAKSFPKSWKETVLLSAERRRPKTPPGSRGGAPFELGEERGPGEARAVGRVLRQGGCWGGVKHCVCKSTKDRSRIEGSMRKATTPKQSRHTSTTLTATTANTYRELTTHGALVGR